MLRELKTDRMQKELSPVLRLCRTGKEKWHNEYLFQISQRLGKIRVGFTVLLISYMSHGKGFIIDGEAFSMRKTRQIQTVSLVNTDIKLYKSYSF